MGQQNVTQQIKNQAVGQIYDRMFKDTEFKASQNAAKAADDVATYEAETDRMAKEGELSVDQHKMRLDGAKAQLEALKGQAQINKDSVMTAKYAQEINDLEFKSTAIKKLMDYGVKDLNNVSLGLMVAAGITPPATGMRKFITLQNPEGNLVDVERGTEIPQGYTLPTKPLSGLTEKQKIDLAYDAGKLENSIEGNLDAAGIGDINFVNTYSKNNYFYHQQKVPGSIYGSNIKGTKYNLPIWNGKQVTSADVMETVNNPDNAVTIEDVLRMLKVLPPEVEGAE